MSDRTAAWAVVALLAVFAVVLWWVGDVPEEPPARDTYTRAPLEER